MIVLVVGVALTAALAWRRLTDRAVSNKAESATAQLRQKWRAVDLDELQRRYVQAVAAANDKGNFDEASALLPDPTEAEFFLGGFVRGGAFEGSYNVSAGWGGHRCIQIRVVGPAPNRIAFQQHDGEC